ncbi:MAG: dephospho-CoA kinase [Actinomycetota bacterium]|nr:dephospho-CoA kinase [Actinomycetota bacterium]
MKLVALTGGIGSGKTTVSRSLAARGAIVVDADAIVHDLQRTGAPLLQRLADRFGAAILDHNGALDRAALAAIAFADDTALADLNGIVHPAVREEMQRRVDDLASSDHVVVMDVPLLEPTTGFRFAAVIVVDVPVDVAVARLVGQRGMSEPDAQARIAKQKSRDERVAMADRVIDNSGDLAALESQVDDVWAWLQTLPDGSP